MTLTELIEKLTGVKAASTEEIVVEGIGDAEEAPTVVESDADEAARDGVEDVVAVSPELAELTEDVVVTELSREEGAEVLASIGDQLAEKDALIAELTIRIGELEASIETYKSQLQSYANAAETEVLGDDLAAVGASQVDSAAEAEDYFNRLTD